MSTLHPLSDTDRATMAATRQFLSTLPGLHLTPDARPFFDDMIRQVPLAEGVTYEPDVLGGVSGWWCRPQGVAQGEASDAVILYLHGGGYVLGCADAYRHPVGQIAAAAGASAFVPDYGLAPEQPFPAAFHDAVAVYEALVSRGFTRVAVVGDSAGGGLALATLASVTRSAAVKPVAAVAVSPWSDMTASGTSFESRAAADALLSRHKLLEAAALYLAGKDSHDPRASPLFGDLHGLPPTLIHVGEDEVLLDDAVRYAERAAHAGSSVELHVWAGMLHVFTSSITPLETARAASKHIGDFLSAHLHPAD